LIRAPEKRYKCPMKRNPTQFVREDWVAACEFDPSPDAHVLDKIIEKIKDNKHSGRPGYVLLDLDSTLYEVAPRTIRILKEAALALEPEVPHPVRSALETLEEPVTGYSIEDTWQKLGLCLKDPGLSQTRRNLNAFWSERFFSNAYLEHDVPYPGTTGFVRTLHSLGAELVYLTGRDAPRMHEGTMKCLHRDGFPIGLPGTHLRMKASQYMDDIEHKVGVAEALQKTGHILASFENEPRNFAALVKAVPQALHVFVETVCSNKPAPAIQGAYRLRRFLPES
jgi:hypothetical protein